MMLQTGSAGADVAPETGPKPAAIAHDTIAGQERRIILDAPLWRHWPSGDMHFWSTKMIVQVADMAQNQCASALPWPLKRSVQFCSCDMAWL